MVSPVSVRSRAIAERDAGGEEHPAAGGEQRPLHLGQPELRLRRRHHDVAAEEQLEPAGHRGGVGGADDGHADLALHEAPEDRLALLLLLRRVAVAGREGAQVHAGGERPVALPVSTTARTPGSASASARAMPRSPISSGLKALRASGRLRRRTSTAPCCCARARVRCRSSTGASHVSRPFENPTTEKRKRGSPLS